MNGATAFLVIAPACALGLYITIGQAWWRRRKRNAVSNAPLSGGSRRHGEDPAMKHDEEGPSNGSAFAGSGGFGGFASPATSPAGQLQLTSPQSGNGNGSAKPMQMLPEHMHSSHALLKRGELDHPLAEREITIHSQIAPGANGNSNGNSSLMSFSGNMSSREVSRNSSSSNGSGSAVAKSNTLSVAAAKPSDGSRRASDENAAEVEKRPSLRFHFEPADEQPQVASSAAPAAIPVPAAASAAAAPAAASADRTRAASSAVAAPAVPVAGAERARVASSASKPPGPVAARGALG